MKRPNKRIREAVKQLDLTKSYSIADAVAILKQFPPVKFDQSVECSLKMGVDPRKSDQAVRGTVSLPNGTGKKIRILVFCRADKVQEALAHGADFVGNEELLAKVAEGWVEFDAVVATPDMMRDVGKLGKVLGPRGLMPTPRAGTVTNDIAGALQELRAGKIEFKNDRGSVVNCAVGKLSFTTEQLEENIKALLHAVWRAKTPTTKGDYMKSLVLSATMGPGVKVDARELIM